jgi:hypothetical protein
VTTLQNLAHDLTRLTCLLALLGAIGCGEKSSGVTVAGTVTYQDKPLESGSLTFYPVSGPGVTTVIEGGAYSCELEPGEYRATVVVGVTLPAGYKEGDPVPPQAVMLPDAYGSRLNTPLSASVTPGMEPLNFALK